MVITARFRSICPKCSQGILPGERVDWERGSAATHTDCPELWEPEDDELSASEDLLAARPAARPAADPADALLDEYDRLVAAANALDDQADRLLDEYDAARRIERLATIPKGIYRVSLHGKEGKYGVDHLNINLIPSEQYGSVKVSEWHGLGLGRINKDGSFAYWPSVDEETRTGDRARAILAAVAIILDAADPIQYARAYAVESETCWRCGADLVDELSRERLLGPTCFKLAGEAA